MIRTSLVAISAAAAVLTAAPVHAAVQVTPAQKEAALWTWRVLERYRYKPEGQSAPATGAILDNYLAALDPDRVLFTRADVDGFEALRAKLAKADDPGQLDAVFRMYDSMRARQEAMLAYAQEQLRVPMDFNGHERLQRVRTNAPWPASDAELRALWAKRVMDDVLNLRLAGVKEADLNPLLAQRYAARLSRLRELSSDEVFGMFMNAYVAAWDPHARYLPPVDSAKLKALSNGQVGVGLVVQKMGEFLTVREVAPGGAAHRSGQLKTGERIVAIGQGEGQPLISVIGLNVDEAVALLRGAKGSTVVLGVVAAGADPGSAPRMVSLVRAPTTIEANRASAHLETVEQGGASYRVAVVEVPAFYQDFAAKREGNPDFTSMAHDVALQLAKLKPQKPDAVLIDMRGNGGGALDEATRFASLFMPGAPVARQRTGDGKLSSEIASGEGVAWEGPLAVLVDQGSAAATEIFAGAVQDNGRGIVIGDRTVGRTSVQTIVSLDRFATKPDQRFGSLRMTVSQVFRATGATFEQTGVAPDLLLPGVIDPSRSAGQLAFPATAVPGLPIARRGNPAVLLPALSQRHAARTSTDPRWQAMLKTRAAVEARRASDEVPLNETERRQASKVQSEAQARIDMRQVQMQEALRVLGDELDLLHKDPKLARDALGQPAASQ